jgi:hypothetical protein
MDDAPRLIAAFSTRGDPLTNLQNIEDGKRTLHIPQLIPGNTVTPSTLHAGMALNQHGIKTVIQALETELKRP